MLIFIQKMISTHKMNKHNHPKNISSISKRIRKVRERIKNLETTDSAKNQQYLRQIEVGFYAFNRNYSELVEWIVFLGHEGFVMSVDSGVFLHDNYRSDYIDLELETFRLTMNLLDSAALLKEHSRTIRNKRIWNEEFTREYDEKKNLLFAKNELSQFIQKLRNYVSHIGFPRLSSHWTGSGTSSILRESYGSDALVSRIFIFDACELLQHSAWNELSRKYLESQGEILYIDALIESYYLLISNFYEWLLKRWKESRSPDELTHLKLLNAAQQEHSNLLVDMTNYIHELMST